MRRLDPRVKVCGAVGVAVWVALVEVQPLASMAAMSVGLLAVAGASRVRLSALAWRASGVLPFALVPLGLGALGGTLDPVRAIEIGARAFTAALAVALLSAVTPASALVAAASALRVPAPLVQTVAFLLRYLDVLGERAAAMRASAAARGYGPRSPRRFAAAGTMLGALLLRSLDRSERVHRSMLARGYTGTLPSLRPPRLRGVDWLAGGSLAVALAGSLFWLR